MKFVLKLTFILAFFFSLSISLHAQIPGTIDGVEINSSADYPSAGQNVRISIESYVTNLNAASVVWLIDGKNVNQGTGITSIQITAPDIGKSMTVTARILTSDGKEVTKIIVIRPGDIDLVWESAGYVPPLYKGKALFAYQNTLKVTALPHLGAAGGKEIDPKTLVYKWTMNDKVIQDQSGYGKQTLTLNEELPRSLDIEVIATSRDGKEQAAGQISLEPGNPSILFYEEDPLYGVFYNKSLNDRYRIAKEEVTVLAVPYFFSSYAQNSPMEYNWGINDIFQEDMIRNRSVVLRTKPGTEGSSLLSLDIRNTAQILQGAQKAVTLYFSTPQVVEENVTF